jgi:hypothetical protein
VNIIQTRIQAPTNHLNVEASRSINCCEAGPGVSIGNPNDNIVYKLKANQIWCLNFKVNIHVKVSRDNIPIECCLHAGVFDLIVGKCS